MSSPDPHWSHANSIVYEATQELLTKVVAIYRSRLSDKDLDDTERDTISVLLAEVEHLKKSISPTDSTLSEIREKYRHLLYA